MMSRESRLLLIIIIFSYIKKIPIKWLKKDTWYLSNIIYIADIAVVLDVLFFYFSSRAESLQKKLISLSVF